MAQRTHGKPPSDYVPIYEGRLNRPGPDVALPGLTVGLRVAKGGAQSVSFRNGQRRDLMPLLDGDNPGEFAALHRHPGNRARGIWAVLA